MGISVKSNVGNQGLGGKIVATLFFGIFFLVGLGFEIMLVRQTAANLSAYGWTAAEATIVASEVSQPEDNDKDPTLHVSYRYTFRGEQHDGNRVEVGSVALQSSEAYLLAERFASQKRVPCWVNPKNPEEAVLLRSSLASAFAVLFPLIFVAVGGIGIWAMWRRKTKSNDDATKPISSRSSNTKNGRRIMIAFFSVFLLVGLGVGYGFFVQPLLKIVAAQNWRQVPCEIVSSRVKTHSGDDGSTYSVDVVYRYTYQDRTYTANSYHFFSGSSSGYEAKAEIVRHLPAGSRTICYIDPSHPFDAVLERGITSTLWFGLIPLVFAIVGGGGLVFSLRTKSGESGSFPVSGPARPTAGGTAAMPPTHDDGPRVLEPSASPKIKLIGVTIAALFWNGIVSVFLFNLVSEWRHGGGFSWFLALFLTPFVGVGLALIGGVFYQFMALFNPRPRITVGKGVALPGDTVNIAWEFAGRADRLRCLQITLEGREEATYRRGTNTSTDKEVFTRIPLVDTTELITMRNGSAKLHVPPGAMHSFKSSNNKIIWALKVHGDIPRWPDVNDEYPFTIAPQPLQNE